MKITIPQHASKDVFTAFGMTLRDHFAGLAMQGLLARKPMSGAEQSHEAYKIADAMLKAREAE